MSSPGAEDSCARAGAVADSSSRRQGGHSDYGCLVLPSEGNPNACLIPPLLPQQLPFSAAIRQATWDAHGDAEQAPYLSDLVAGRVDRRGYADLVAQHHFAYLSLEAASELMRDDPVAGGFVDDALTRGPALEADLESLLGPDWRDAGRPQRRHGRLRRPHGRGLPHLARRLRRPPLRPLPGRPLRRPDAPRHDRAGLRDRRHERHRVLRLRRSSPDLTAFKDAYRARLDAAPWDDEERARIIDEVLLGYHHNTEVLEELGR